LNHAFPYDELKPLTCTGVNTWSTGFLTLIDALDTLAVMGNYSEFRRVVKIIESKVDFDRDINVSVFETNIRIVGGLISAHLLSHKAGEVEIGYPCNGPLLRLAEKVARKLLPAFDTKSGMPYGTVNLKYGVPEGETPITCTAGIGTFIVEFGALSRLTGDPIFEEVAMNALHSLFNHRSSKTGLFGNHIDVQSGIWTAQDAGIGAGVDSYFEYLVKGSIMTNRPELYQMFLEGREAIDKYLKRDDWHIWASMSKGQLTLPIFQSLQAFWPGLLSMIGDPHNAMRSMHNIHTILKQYGFLPEFFNIGTSEAGSNRESHPLRPELIESVMYLYRATGDPWLLEVGEDILRAIQYSAKTSCGYATIKNVKDHRKQDTMESFFLAETTKYLYLLFDPDNFLNTDGGYGLAYETVNGECILESYYIFNTEAHPIDIGALKCCHDVPRESLVKGFDKKKFMGDSIVKFDTEIPTPSTNDFLGMGEINEISIGTIFEEKQKQYDDVKAEVLRKFAELQSRLNLKELNIPEKVEDKEPIEIVKLPSNALDSESVKTKPKEVEIEEEQVITEEIEETSTVTPPPQIIKKDTQPKIITKSSSDTNNNIISEFVKTILSTTNKPKKFDSQALIEKIRAMKIPKNDTWETRYDIMTCKAQPYLQRISVLGEFY
jgi:ER degradation enhancer, mannosidase alpha-like 2